MYKNTKKIISVILAIAMMFSFMAVPAFAEDAIEETVEVIEQYEETVEADSALAEETDDVEVLDAEEETEIEEEISAEEETDETIELMSIEPDTTYTVIAGLTRSFENLATVELTVKTNNKYMDYIVYFKDGSIKQYYRNTYNQNIAVPAGGILIITARQNNVDCTLADDYFIVEDVENPVFNTRNISERFTYSFTNTSLVPIKLLLTNHRCDYIVYNTDGTVKEYQRDTYFDSKEIAAGNTIKITSRNNELEVCPLYDYFSVAQCSDKVFKKVYISKGETYSFTNTSDSPYSLLSNSTYRDYIMYDGNGAVTGIARDTYWGNSKIEIPANSTIKITARHSGLEICGINEFFTVKKESTQVFKKVVIPAGETYSFTNTSDSPYSLLSNGTYGDYIMYNSEGNIIEYSRDTYFGNKEIPSGYTIKITTRRSGLEICGINEFFTVKKESTQVFKTIEIPEGEKYKFTNIGTDNFKILAAGHYCDYVIYNSTGTATSSKVNVNINNLVIPAGYSVVVFANYGPTECCVVNEAFVATHEDGTGLFTLFEKDKIYEITNLDAADYEFSAHSNAYICDYIVYGEEDTIIEHNPTVINETIAIPSGGRTIVVAKSSFLIKKDDKISITECDTPVYKRIEINAGETYYFDNATLMDLSLRIPADGNGACDYIIYNKNSTINTYATDQRFQTLKVPSESKIAITARNSKIIVFALNDNFTVNKGTEKTFIRKELQAGQSIKFKNITLKDYKVHFRDNNFDYVIYNADNSIKQYGYNAGESEFTIASNGYIIITARQPVVIDCLKEAFEVTDIDGSVFNYNHMYAGETLVVKNVSPKDHTAFIATHDYDYVAYDALDKISTSEMEVNTTSMKLASGTSVAITALTGSCTIVTLNDIFNVKTRSYPAMMRKTLYENEKYSFTNTYGEKCILRNSNQKIDYVIYTETDSPVDAKEEEYKSTMEIPAGGRADVTIKSSNVMFAGPYEAFSGEDLTVKATVVVISAESLNLVKGKQSILTATVLPEDATNKAVLWSSSDSSIVSVAQTGKITAKECGTATITVTTEDGSYTATCEVTVTDGVTNVPVTGVSLNKTSTTLKVGGTEILTATVAPDNATNKSVNWTSSNNNIATVSNGVIIAKSEGTAIIIATSADGGKTATCTVTVTADVPSVSRGDLNADGGIDVRDVIYLRRFITGGYGIESTNDVADINKDSGVDVRDVIYLRRFITGGYGIEL